MPCWVRVNRCASGTSEVDHEAIIALDATWIVKPDHRSQAITTVVNEVRQVQLICHTAFLLPELDYADLMLVDEVHETRVTKKLHNPALPIVMCPPWTMLVPGDDTKWRPTIHRHKEHDEGIGTIKGKAPPVIVLWLTVSFSVAENITNIFVYFLFLVFCFLFEHHQRQHPTEQDCLDLGDTCHGSMALEIPCTWLNDVARQDNARKRAKIFWAKWLWKHIHVYIDIWTVPSQLATLLTLK